MKEQTATREMHAPATSRFSPGGIKETRRLVARLMPHLEWRHNGLGLLQAYVMEGEVEETRIHIWHPDLMKDGIKNSGQLHNHRFMLKSTVLHGYIEHVEYGLTPGATGFLQTYPVVNARKAMAAEGSFDGTVTEDPQRYHAALYHMFFKAGDGYVFKKRAYHATHVDGLCITMVSKGDQDDIPARILAPTGSNPVHAFADPMPRDEWQPYLASAIAALNNYG